MAWIPGAAKTHAFNSCLGVGERLLLLGARLVGLGALSRQCVRRFLSPSVIRTTPNERIAASLGILVRKNISLHSQGRSKSPSGRQKTFGPLQLCVLYQSAYLTLVSRP